MITFDTYESALGAVTADTGQEIFDPATGELIGIAALSTTADLEAAIKTARAAQKSFAQLSEAERCDALLKMADAIEANAEPLAQLLSREQGKPLNGPNARFEVGACAAWLRATASFDSPDFTAVDADVKAIVRYRPLGVVGAIGPWNWPSGRLRQH